jgi:hypothetical protein
MTSMFRRPTTACVAGVSSEDEDWETTIADGESAESSGRSALVNRFLVWYHAQTRPKMSGNGLDRERLETLARWTVADVYAIRRDDRIVFLQSPSRFIAECKESMDWAIRFHHELVLTERWLARRSAEGVELAIDQDFLDLIRRITDARVHIGGRIRASDVAASANYNLVTLLGKSTLPRRPTHLLRLQQRLVSRSLQGQLRRRFEETLDPGKIARMADDPDDGARGYFAELQEVIEFLIEAYAGDEVRGLSDREVVAFHDRHIEPDPRPTQKETAQRLGVTDRTLRTYLTRAEKKVDTELRRRGAAGGFAPEERRAP